ncbi:U4/U6-U5 snRNP complex subunit SPP381 Ecym_5337 [Eremothecium cymbalariae DBVPG|uniref:Micro-fibrillar-associated protein 1 C-terminal domain-containing protein n=1 Tax=Eremothecium cymbalariae (strain CBS 270.75 / DBVPG 7215 / KCTC 17166 / NRRL Y-17582) TaxID=931890 RepID=I6NDF4_ERECY|nr:hypothetical protein Ecym_5337 [Eremothecium cymbalariae DBVPG\
MVIRHFRKPGVVQDSDSASSDDEIYEDGSRQSKIDEEEADGSETNDESDSTDDSSSDEEGEPAVFHRPVFLKKVAEKKVAEKKGLLAETITDGKADKPSRTLEHVKYFNDIRDKVESTHGLLTTYSTDKELVNQILQLDDDDSDDNDDDGKKEHHRLWLERREKRRNRLRGIELQKQLELEEYELNKQSNQESQSLLEGKQSSSHYYNRLKNNNTFSEEKGERLPKKPKHSIKLKSSIASDNAAENEYSVL